MIDIRLLRESPDVVRAALARRGDYTELLDRLTTLDRLRRELLLEAEQLKATRNASSEQVAALKKQGRDATALIAEMKGVSQRIKTLDDEVRETERSLEETALKIPNPTLVDVPAGDATQNVVLREWGERPAYDFPAKPHWELGEALGILDLPRGAKLTGSGFPVFMGLGARLVRALINFMLDLHVREHGYREVHPPFLVNADTARGTGQLPDLGQDMYVTVDGLYLIPTAEVPVTNLHRDEMLPAADLPLAYVAYTPCFRREAGAHGKDTRGLIRIHQFDKVELVRFCAPADSPSEHELMLAHVEAVFQRLEIPYRIVLLAAGDTGRASAKTYDVEVWAAGIGAWLEGSSASTFTDYQARRANIRYRPNPSAKPGFVHTLNASGVALPRTIIALLENNQEPDGSVRVPAALAPYLGSAQLVPGDAS